MVDGRLSTLSDSHVHAADRGWYGEVCRSRHKGELIMESFLNTFEIVLAVEVFISMLVWTGFVVEFVVKMGKIL